MSLSWFTLAATRTIHKPEVRVFLLRGGHSNELQPSLYFIFASMVLFKRTELITGKHSPINTQSDLRVWAMQ
jgi:hypothetical protein